MNYAAARALGLHLCGLYVRTEVREARWSSALPWANRQHDQFWEVVAWHAAGFRVVYSQPM